MTAPQKLSEMSFRTHALLAENPEDDDRLHHVYWVCAPSGDKAMAAKGLYDITRVEISSCEIFCGQGIDLVLEEALAKLEELEKALRAKGGQPLDEKNDAYHFQKMGKTYATAHHFSRYEELRAEEIAQISADSTRLENDIKTMKRIRFKNANGDSHTAE